MPLSGKADIYPVERRFFMHVLFYHYVKMKENVNTVHKTIACSSAVSKVEHHYSLGEPCYALYFGPRRDRDPRWVPAIVTTNLEKTS